MACWLRACHAKHEDQGLDLQDPRKFQAGMVASAQFQPHKVGTVFLGASWLVRPALSRALGLIERLYLIE